MIQLLFCLVTLMVHAADSSNGRQARAVIDLGSGTTKLMLAEIETGAGDPKLVAEWPEGLSVPLALEAAKTDDGSIPKEAQDEALKVLRELREKALHAARFHGYKKIELTVIGTHALRTAKNRDEVIAKFSAEGFPTQAITQAEEARAGYYGVMLSHRPEKCPQDTLVVWDVGGGSMQLTRAKEMTPNFVGLPLGSEGFKQKAIALKKHPSADPSCPSPVPTPNPLGKNNLLPLKNIARREAANAFKNKKMWPVSCVVGIGGLHTKAIEAQVVKNWDRIKACTCGKRQCLHVKNSYTRRELDCLSQSLAPKTDCDPALKGPYSTSGVSSLLLILGFMEQLKIGKVTTVSVNMGPYFAMNPSNVNFIDLSVP